MGRNFVQEMVRKWNGKAVIGATEDGEGETRYIQKWHKMDGYIREARQKQGKRCVDDG